jgi:glycogen operon protein
MTDSLAANAILATGTPDPLGATPHADGVNFSVYANHAEALDLLLFDSADAAAPGQVLRLDRRGHHTAGYWHAFLPGLAPGQVYAYRAHGPTDPARGWFHDPDKVLLDPYGRAVVVPETYSRGAAAAPGDNSATAMRSVVADPASYDWQGDAPLRRPFAHTVIYELHVAGFTRHPNSGVAQELRGSYAGLIEKIPYLRDLGITAVELLPVFQFDASTAPPGLVNYWGYQPISFFAPHGAYSSRRDPLGALDEFRDMVKALHRAGIEVILDVVYNHTAEGFEPPATLCYRGLANSTYYTQDPAAPYGYADYTGCGNTLNAGHSVVRRMIADSLRYWVREMHVDGFRFDLAAVLSRGEDGAPLPSPPVIWDIDSDPALAGTKLVAEAWDAAGLYQVGSFVGEHWQEWNGRFRDDLRGFVKSDGGLVPALIQRLSGSPDVYGHECRAPEQSVNFVTVHDGFTLNDLVSYDRKHNEVNGHASKDGSDDNRSWNCGVEGPTDDPAIEALRNRQVKNCLTLLLTAVGAPLLAMGDEVRRTQRGNNNAYDQDNETSWFDWSLVARHADVHRFTRRLIAARLLRTADRTDDDTLAELLRRADLSFHGVDGAAPDEGYDSHALAVSARLDDGRLALYLMINAYWQALDFQLPPAPDWADQGWHCWLDTQRETPDDIHAWSDAPAVEGDRVQVGPRTIVALVARSRGA